VDVKAVSRDITVAEFGALDHFYLLSWARDLSYHFPFLDPRTTQDPYELFYYIWKLSYLFGRTYGQASFGFEELCQSPGTELPRLMDAAGIESYNISALSKLVVPQKSRWSQFADQQWFADREARCESTLARFLA
jgi:hypothetical protein